jgi:hypothetical protein
MTKEMIIEVLEGFLEGKYHYDQAAAEIMEMGEKEVEEFTEWVGTNYVKLHKVWVHRFASQTQPENFLTFAQLRSIFASQQATMKRFLNSSR